MRSCIRARRSSCGVRGRARRTVQEPKGARCIRTRRSSKGARCRDIRALGANRPMRRYTFKALAAGRWDIPRGKVIEA